jgi:hypothetical protein
LIGYPETEKALEILRRDFSDPDSVGPRRVAAFITGGRDATIEADVVGYVAQLVKQCANAGKVL